MLTGWQIRAARALLDWSQLDLADKAGVSIASIRRMESHCDVPRVTITTIEKIRATFEDAGVSITLTDKIIGLQRTRGNVRSKI